MKPDHFLFPLVVKQMQMRELLSRITPKSLPQAAEQWCCPLRGLGKGYDFSRQAGSASGKHPE
jgi:hypothetical protein